MLRGKEVSRLEGFSDAVFGFALTLLVVSLEVPENYAELHRVLVGFPAFAVTFTVICWVWYEHYLLFRRYEINDGFTVLLNCTLLFIVVFYAYPMKFMFTRLISGSVLGLVPGVAEGMTFGDARQLMMWYSGGFMALFGTFLLLHWNALRQRDALELDTLTVFDAKASIKRHAITVTTAFVSMALAALGPPRFIGVAGLIFFVLGPAHATFGYYNGRARQRAQAALDGAFGRS